MPTLSHNSPRRITPGIESWVYYSKQPATKAIVFVHGFNGNSIETWANFHGFIFNDPEFAEYDCFFFGYDGLWHSLTASAQRFYAFLKLLFTNDANSNKELSRPPSRSGIYESVVIAAHSMGSIVVRRGQLLAQEDNATWISSTKLVLFAPAHFGARVQKMLNEMLRGIWKILPSVVGYEIPALSELEPGSEILSDLLQDVNNSLLDDPQREYLRANIVHAYGDNVVVGRNKRFGEDKKAEWIEGTHTSACKPVTDDLSPLKVFKRVLH